MVVKISGNSSPTAPSFAGDDGDSGLHASADQVQLVTNSTVAMTVDSSQRVGIGTATVTDKVTLAHSDATGITFKATGTDGATSAKITFEDTAGGTGGVLTFDHNDNSFKFATAGTTERARIDSSGRLGIGVTSPAQLLHLSSTGFPAIRVTDADNGTYFDIVNSDGDIILKADEGNTFANSAIRLNVDGTERMRIESNGRTRFGNDIYPSTDNAFQVGLAALRWSVIYAGTGSINTSDATLKCDVADLDAAELAVASAIKGLIKKFRFVDAVELKGDNARIHVGVIAQEVEQAFVAEGLDPRRYGLFCEDTLEDGSKRLGIRYDELLAFVIAANSAAIETLETINASFEARISALEGGN